MERSAVYRRALAPIMTFCGVIGILAGAVGWWAKIDSDRGFVLFWSAVAALALLGSLFLVRRQALKDAEPFWSPPTRRIALAMLPPFAIGLFIGIAIGGFGSHPSDSVMSNILVMAWAWLYGCALHAAGFFISRGVRILGWVYCVSGCVLLAEPFTGWYLPPHIQMGALFGGLHLVCGIYLYFTEKRGNET
jgi:hypothetical protein